MGWDPIGDLKKTVNRTVQDIGRSDIGKVVEAVTAPVRSTVRAGESLARGDLEGAAGNIMHAALASNPVAVAMNASSSLRELGRHDTVNTLTLGLTKDYTELMDKGRSASYGRDIDATDWSVAGRTTLRAGAIAGAIIAAPTVGSWASSLTAKEGLAGAATVAGLAKNPKEGVTNLVNEIIPGAGDFVGELIPGSGGGAGRAPASGSSSQSPTVIQMPSQQTANGNLNTILVISGVGIVGLVALLAFRGNL